MPISPEVNLNKDLFKTALDPELIACVSYNCKNGPGTPLEVILRAGGNCQWYTHIAHQILTGASLPPWALSEEIFNNVDGLFPPVDYNSAAVAELLLPGDIFLFGSKITTLPRHFPIPIGNPRRSIFLLNNPNCTSTRFTEPLGSSSLLLKLAANSSLAAE